MSLLRICMSNLPELIQASLCANAGLFCKYVSEFKQVFTQIQVSFANMWADSSKSLHICRSLLKICRSLLQICRSLLQICRSLLQICRSLLQICRGLTYISMQVSFAQMYLLYIHVGRFLQLKQVSAYIGLFYMQKRPTYMFIYKRDPHICMYI